MIDIVFVNQFDWETRGIKVIPIGLLSLIQTLKHEGFDARICDFNRIYTNKEIKLTTNYQLNLERMAQYLLSYQSYIVSFYTMANNFHTAVGMCKLLKELNPNIITILAGPQATSVAQHTIELFPYVDLVSMGEGELTICKIVEHLKKWGTQNLGEVNGICYREGKNVIINWDKKCWVDVNELPILDFSQIPDFGKEKVSVLEMEIGRGCPFSCTYCSTSLFWGRNYRVKHHHRVLKEIQYYISEYGCKNIFFRHDLFTLNKQYV